MDSIEKQVDKSTFYYFFQQFYYHYLIKKNGLISIQGKYFILSILICLTIICLLIFWAGRYFHNQNRKEYHKLRSLIKEEKIAIQQIFEGHEILLVELKNKIINIERTLLLHQLNYERQQSIIDKIVSFLKKIVYSPNPKQLKQEIHQLSRSLDLGKHQNNQWGNFSLQIEKIHPQFFSNLLNQNDSLKSRDLKLCTYIRLGMDNQEIAEMLGIENTSVIKARYRLKKKLHLEKDLDLNQFLLNL